MKFQIRHEIRGRMRIHVIQSRMSFAQADTLQYYLEQCESVISAKIQKRFTVGAVVISNQKFNKICIAETRKPCYTVREIGNAVDFKR